MRGAAKCCEPPCFLRRETRDEKCFSYRILNQVLEREACVVVVSGPAQVRPPDDVLIYPDAFLIVFVPASYDR